MATEPHWRLFCLAATMSTSALDKAESGVDENRMVEEYMEVGSIRRDSETNLSPPRCGGEGFGMSHNQNL
jgi:hypothetical protein